MLEDEVNVLLGALHALALLFQVRCSHMFHAILLRVYALTFTFTLEHTAALEVRFTFVYKKRCAYLRACQMLTLVEVMLSGTSHIIIQQYKQAVERVVEIILLHHRVGAQEDFVLVGHVSAIHKLIAHDQLDVVSPEHKIILQQCILHGRPVLAIHEFLIVLLGLQLRILLESFNF